MLNKLHSKVYALLPAGHVQNLPVAAPIFCESALRGSVQVEPVTLGLTGPVQAVYNGLISGRSLASVCLF